MKAKRTIFSFLLVISVFYAVLISVLFRNSYNIEYYRGKFIENNIMGETELSEEELVEIGYGLIDYLKKGDNELLEPYFNDREIAHMVDVYDLFEIARTVLMLSLAVAVISIFILSQFGYKYIAKTLLFGLLIIIGTLVVFGIYTSKNFNFVFTKFHELLFTNDLWLMDPKTDLMIQMLTEDFFMDLAFKIGYNFIAIISVIIGISGLSLYFDRKD